MFDGPGQGKDTKGTCRRAREEQIHENPNLMNTVLKPLALTK